MIDLEMLACVRAEEQMEHPESWRRAGERERREEALAPRLCVLCGKELHGRGPALLCPECRAEGWSATPCKGCGGRRRRLDETAVGKSRRGFCPKCRAEMPQVQRGAEVLARPGVRFVYERSA